MAGGRQDSARDVQGEGGSSRGVSAARITGGLGHWASVVTDSSKISNTNSDVTWEIAVGRRGQIQRRLSPSESTDLCAAYQNGQTIRELTTQFGIHKTTVTAVLERAGVARRIRTISADEVHRAIELYGTGLSTAAVGAKLGFSAETIRSSLMRSGAELRPRRGWEAGVRGDQRPHTSSVPPGGRSVSGTGERPSGLRN